MQEKSLESTEIFNTVLGIVSLCIYLFPVSIIFAIHFMIFLPSAFDKTNTIRYLYRPLIFARHNFRDLKKNTRT